MRKKTMQELNRPSPEVFQQKARNPITLVLDNVRSGMNVGSAFRTADGFGLERVLLCGITAVPPHREILKTALGATETVPWEYHQNPVEALLALKEKGCRIIAVEQAEGSVLLQNFSVSPGQAYALVFGNEVNGVSEEVMAIVDGAIEIPQSGSKHSLNIAVCVGIVAWELVRQVAGRL